MAMIQNGLQYEGIAEGDREGDREGRRVFVLSIPHVPVSQSMSEDGQKLTALRPEEAPRVQPLKPLASVLDLILK